MKLREKLKNKKMLIMRLRGASGSLENLRQSQATKDY